MIIWNNKIPRTVEFEGASYTFKPMDLLEQADYLDELEKTMEKPQKSRRDLINLSYIVLNKTLISVEGLKDAEGKDIVITRDEKGELDKAFIIGYSFGTLAQLAKTITEAGNLSVQEKKSAPSPEPVGSDT